MINAIENLIQGQDVKIILALTFLRETVCLKRKPRALLRPDEGVTLSLVTSNSSNTGLYASALRISARPVELKRLSLGEGRKGRE